MNTILLKFLTFFTSIFIAVHPVSHISTNTSANVIKSPTNVVLTQSTPTPTPTVDCKPIIKTVIVYRNLPAPVPTPAPVVSSSTTTTASVSNTEKTPTPEQQVILNECSTAKAPPTSTSVNSESIKYSGDWFVYRELMNQCTEIKNSL